MNKELSIARPRTTLSKLREIVIPPETPSDSSIYLIITMDSEEVNIREFSAYLRFVDKTYGRLSHQGLASYSQTPSSQLRTSFRKGSLEVLISNLVSNPDPIIVLCFLLKYLPAASRDFAQAFYYYEKGMMVRERRKKLRDEIKRDAELAELDNNRQNEIIAFLDALYGAERQHLVAAQRFAIKYVQKITLTVTRKDEPPK